MVQQDLIHPEMVKGRRLLGVTEKGMALKWEYHCQNSSRTVFKAPKSFILILNLLVRGSSDMCSGWLLLSISFYLPLQLKLRQLKAHLGTSLLHVSGHPSTASFSSMDLF